MARFFIHLHECGTVTLDDQGKEFSSVAIARNEAIRAAREVMCAEIKDGRLCMACYIEVLDDAGAVMSKVMFADAVRITGLP